MILDDNSFWQIAGGALFGFMAGFLSAKIIGFRRRADGRVRPEIDREWLAPRWFQILIVTLFLVSGSVSVSFSLNQRICNAEFQQSSLELRRIRDEDRSLEARDDALRNKRDDAMTALVSGFLSPRPVGERIDGLALLDHFAAVTHEIDVKRDELFAQRAALEQQRRAQPEPKERC